MMSLLGGVLVTDAAKAQALRQIRQLALDLTAKRTAKELSEGALYKLMLRIYGALMLDVTKRSVAKGVPVIGAGVGAATNYYTVRRTIVAANHAYPERWILDKYETESVEVIDVEEVERAVDAAISDEDRGVLDRLDEVDESEPEGGANDGESSEG